MKLGQILMRCIPTRRMNQRISQKKSACELVCRCQYDENECLIRRELRLPFLYWTLDIMISMEWQACEIIQNHTKVDRNKKKTQKRYEMKKIMLEKWPSNEILLRLYVFNVTLQFSCSLRFFFFNFSLRWLTIVSW